MGLQSIINRTEFTNFLREGALLQLSADQFKLIWGPFLPSPDKMNVSAVEKTVIFKPQFWDFTSASSPLTYHLMGTHELSISRSSLLQLLRQQESEVPVIRWLPLDEKDFKAQYQWSFEKFAQGLLQKSVPIISQHGEIDWTSFHLSHALISLLSEEHYGSTFGFWSQGQGFVGHSPELIAEWEAETSELRTVALAGTYSKQLNSEKLILKDAKILKEHQIVVDDLKSELQQLFLEKNLQIKPISVLPLKFLDHLQTKISIRSVELNQVQACIAAIHPTAALGLFPRDENLYKEFQKFETQRHRLNFAAPFGFITSKHIKVIAAIRSLYFYDSTVQIFSGCGVTDESILQIELAELTEKRNSVKKMMGLSS